MENLLLVEGLDDIHAISQLLNTHGLTRLRDSKDRSIHPLKLFFEDRPLNIDHVANEDDVVAKFESILEFANRCPKVVGLVLDFDAPTETQANNRDVGVMEAIRRLQDKGCRWNLPNKFTVLSDTGFIADPTGVDTPRIGVWLMPNNRDRGMLETFLQGLISESRSDLLDYARRSTDTAKEKYQAPFLPVHRDKAVVHTFLAWMDKPGRPFGISFQNGSFDAKSASAYQFVEWMKTLFRNTDGTL